jgi:LmbE family N-acetylglucosaminyl deacetylase
MNPQTLILAAHPDDELIGCGVILQRNPDTQVVIVTDGRMGGDKARPELEGDRLAKQREQESRTVLAGLGVSEVRFLRQAEFTFRPLAVLDELHRMIGDGAGLRSVFSHHLNDEHPDHVKVGTIALLLAQQWDLVLWQFSIAPLHPMPSPPDWIMETTAAERERKTNDLLRYRTQVHVTKDFRDDPERFWRGWPHPDL